MTSTAWVGTSKEKALGNQRCFLPVMRREIGRGGCIKNERKNTEKPRQEGSEVPEESERGLDRYPLQGYLSAKSTVRKHTSWNRI